MSTALVSALSGGPCATTSHDRRDHPAGPDPAIGGVKEKVLVRCGGITTIVLPKENAADLDDLPRRALVTRVHVVEDLDEV